MQIIDDLDRLLEILPEDVRLPIQQHPQREELVEVVMDLGRRPEARFAGKAEYLSERVIERQDIEECIQRLGTFSGDNRAGIERTLHRISAMRNRSGEAIGLTCRVGRAIFGTVQMIRDLVETGSSILMLGRPGVGKTTALREIARVLADELEKRVVIVDTSNEIAGDGDIPHPAIGRARRMQVTRPELQHQVMIEAVENHMPEVIVIDEIGTELEALAARTIAERGVQLVGTAHGNYLENLIKNPTLSDLIGGIQSVTLGDDEAKRRGSQKTVLERKAPPTFQVAVEMASRERWIVHENVAETVDLLLRQRQPQPQIRTLDENGEVSIIRELPQVSKNDLSTSSYATTSSGSQWRASGKMQPLPVADEQQHYQEQQRYFEQLLNASTSTMGDVEPYPANGEMDNGEDEGTLYLYPYGISRHKLEQVVQALQWPVRLTKEINEADAILALRSQVKNHSKIKQVAKTHHVPIHTVKEDTVPKITQTLQRLLQMDDVSSPELANLLLNTHGKNSEDEIEALEEARLAVEQIVIPQGQPVELLPRCSKIRKMQHELVEHYRLKSISFGDEPNRRLRIFPA
ncbi:R3H domain-containing nucleic acid-binding protein [Geitlerinema sp. PCC 9228]|jgi:stage III sporulation protein SpoIIIAA|uniref:R3H domain-containing nucleic acid-binding protein n=1 Tax=Geitlerinema sp. PCC 9228 TaxID=111611 RepID=UPI0008F989E7|nr:R3H domain-containing nucleic acid-binding protein [Geitlerinema sp. PCC 9228]